MDVLVVDATMRGDFCRGERGSTNQGKCYAPMVNSFTEKWKGKILTKTLLVVCNFEIKTRLYFRARYM